MPRISTGKPIHYSHKSNIREKSLLSTGNDCERMPRISAGNPIHKSYERNPGKILSGKGKITGWEHVHP